MPVSRSGEGFLWGTILFGQDHPTTRRRPSPGALTGALRCRGVSRPGEFHPQPLAEPSVRLSLHSAPIRQMCWPQRSASERRDPCRPNRALSGTKSGIQESRLLRLPCFTGNLSPSAAASTANKPSTWIRRREARSFYLIGHPMRYGRPPGTPPKWIWPISHE